MIMEFRTYTMQPGTREEFARFFEQEVIPRMRAAGMTVLGQFSSVTDPNVFAYARTFESVEARERQYRAFYESEDWLGWMIDTAMGKEESFIVFLGDSDSGVAVHPGGLSGVHSDRFTIATSRGPAAETTADSITVDGDDGVRMTYRLHEDVRVFHTPNGGGMTAAVPIKVSDLGAGDSVLVLGAQTPDGPVARQIVKRAGTGRRDKTGADTGS